MTQACRFKEVPGAGYPAQPWLADSQQLIISRAVDLGDESPEESADKSAHSKFRGGWFALPSVILRSSHSHPFWLAGCRCGFGRPRLDVVAVLVSVPPEAVSMDLRRV